MNGLVRTSGYVLCPMTGLISPENVVQFRAIPYATIPARFARSVLKTNLDGAEDFTKHGFQCPQTFPSSASGGPLPGDTIPPISSEFACLILQLAIPLSVLQDPVHAAKLPVLVYFHGGGFVLGGIDEQHNTALLTQQSISDAQPIVTASIQYRIGALGYLHVPELGSANRALHDQRNALLWIREFIGGFGGDGGNVTLFGESAGSISICSQMLFAAPHSGPLFRRVVLMSGVLGASVAPGSMRDAEIVYESFLTKLGIEERGEAGLERLRGVDVQEIVRVTAEFTDGGAMFKTVQDADWFGEDDELVTWDRFPEMVGRCEWVDEIVLGTTGFEGVQFIPRFAGVTPQDFIAAIADQLGEESAKLISQAYSITRDIDQTLFLSSALRWIGDAIFGAPHHEWSKYLSTHTNKKIYRYVFDVRNPFPGSPLYQQAHHWVDKYFLFKTLQFRYPTQRLKDISTRHAQLWIDFANGKPPWRQYRYTGNGDETIMVADEREGWTERTVADHEKITETSWRTCETLFASWQGKMGKAFSPVDIEPLGGKSMVRFDD